MSDIAAIEAIADALVDANNNGVDELEDHAEYVLDALRAAGFDVYRPDECERIVIGEGIGLEPGPWSMVVDWDVGEAYVETDLPDGTYRLVPVDAEGG